MRRNREPVCRSCAGAPSAGKTRAVSLAQRFASARNSHCTTTAIRPVKSEHRQFMRELKSPAQRRDWNKPPPPILHRAAVGIPRQLGGVVGRILQEDGLIWGCSYRTQKSHCVRLAAGRCSQSARQWNCRSPMELPWRLMSCYKAATVLTRAVISEYYLSLRSTVVRLTSDDAQRRSLRYWPQ